MMKFYSKPEIEALALETVDVIETSTEGAQGAKLDLVARTGVSADDVTVISQQVADMSTEWSW